MNILLFVFLLVEWRTFGNNLENTHLQAWKGAMTSAVVKWQYDAGQIESHDPILVDLNSDGLLEVIFGGWSSDKIHALNYNGTSLWEYQTGAGVWGAAAVADIDNDGQLEIVIGGWDYKVYALNHDGTLLWSYTTGDRISSSPAIVDIDGNGDLEIIIGGVDSKIYALNHDGTLLWSYATGGQIYYSSVAVADINMDGNYEILIGSNDTKIYAINYDGTLLWSYPTGGIIWSGSPSVADIDGDGYSEVICGSTDHNLYALNHDGTLLWSYTASNKVSATSIGDINKDGSLDIAFGDWSGNLYVLNNMGILLWSQNVGGVIHFAPALADVDGDDYLELIVPNNQLSTLYCYNHDGTVCWSIQLGYDIHGITVGDIDNDGCIEIVTGTASPGRLWALDDPSNQSGCGPIGVEERDNQPFSDISMWVSGREIHFSIKESGYTSLFLYDIAGRRIKTIFTGYLGKGSYTMEIYGVHLGVYFVVLTKGDKKFSEKTIIF